MTNRQMYAKEGFFLVPGILDVSDVSAMRASVLGHLNKHSLAHHKSLGGAGGAGWYIADFPRHSELQHILTRIMAKDLGDMGTGEAHTISMVCNFKWVREQYLIRINTVEDQLML